MTFMCYDSFDQSGGSAVLPRISDCNPGTEFSIPGFGIEKFVILGSPDFISGLGF